MTNPTPPTGTFWPKPAGHPADAPKRIKRPCDWGLECAAAAAEVQLGTIEAYNRIVELAAAMRAKIEAGKALPQNGLYAVNIKGG